MKILCRAVDAKHRRDSQVIPGLRALRDPAYQRNERNAAQTRTLGDAGNDLAVNTLAVNPTLTGNYQFRILKHSIEANRIQHALNTRLKLCV